MDRFIVLGYRVHRGEELRMTRMENGGEELVRRLLRYRGGRKEGEKERKD